jgi:hypothetical protein
VKFNYVYLIVLVVVSAACSQQAPCLKNSTVAARVKYRTTVDTLTRDSVLAQSFLAYPALSAQAASFGVSSAGALLNSSNVNTTLLFSTDSNATLQDTIVVYHKKQLNFVSKACGYNYFFSIDSINYTTNILKSISLRDSLVTDDNSKINMWFYL